MNEIYLLHRDLLTIIVNKGDMHFLFYEMATLCNLKDVSFDYFVVYLM